MKLYRRLKMVRSILLCDPHCIPVEHSTGWVDDDTISDEDLIKHTQEQYGDNFQYILKEKYVPFVEKNEDVSNLVDYAKEELKRIGMIDSGEEYNDWVSKEILDLIELFASQGHSGFTAPYVINAFSRLAMFKPISPLTGEDDEWNELSDGSFQNKRYSAVFKGKDGVAYNIEGKAFTDDGELWYTCKDSRVDVTFPYAVPDKPEYVYRNKEDKVLTVGELIEYLKQMPQNAHVYAEGELADKVIFEKSPDGNGGIVRIFKAWNVKFVGRGIAPSESEDKNASTM